MNQRNSQELSISLLAKKKFASTFILIVPSRKRVSVPDGVRIVQRQRAGSRTDHQSSPPLEQVDLDLYWIPAWRLLSTFFRYLGVIPKGGRVKGPRWLLSCVRLIALGSSFGVIECCLG